MIEEFLNRVLPFVRKPARYIGGEYNSIVKDGEDLLRVALVFPDVYEIGMSNHGLAIIYEILNSKDWIWAERAYLPWVDMIEKMKECDIPLFTLESKTPLNEMDIIGISLEYELSYTNVLEILKLSNIPIRAQDRKDTHPLIIGGGPLASNPEPVAPAFDAILVGDGEEAVLEIAEVVYKTRGMERHERLKELARIDGVYVPVFYEQRGGKILPKFEDVPYPVKKRILKDLDSFPPPLRPVIPNVESIHDRAVVEVMRGCTRGCRFCHAGMVYRPVREREPGELAEWILELLNQTGYEEISLLSLSTMDYTALDNLVNRILPHLKSRNIALSIPSTRVDEFGLGIAEKIAGIRKTGLTFAPEAGTQRLRDVVNKNITDEDILRTATLALKAGWRRIKLYFMIGLPTETEEDLMGIVDVVRRIKSLGFRDLRVAVSVFVPKPHTPFQFARQISPEEAREKQKILKRARRFAKVDFHDPEMSLVEGVLSRGGREIFGVIERVNESGEIFDEWSEMFSFSKWIEAFEKEGIDPTYYTRGRELDEEFPWDHIYIGIDREFLVRDYLRALRGETVPDCRWDRCSLCGMCIKFKVRNVLKGKKAP